MTVRNWWIEANIDGRRTMLEGGPRSKDGGFSLRIYQREEGRVTQAGHLDGMVDNEGNLILRGRIGEDNIEHITKR